MVGSSMGRWRTLKFYEQEDSYIKPIKTKSTDLNLIWDQLTNRKIKSATVNY